MSTASWSGLPRLLPRRTLKAHGQTLYQRRQRAKGRKRPVRKIGMDLRRALFLDRDGVINVDRDFVHRIEEFEFREGIFDLARMAKSHDLLLIVVTNQSGIGRGYYTEEDFATLTAWMCRRFEDEEAAIDRVYHCPVHPDFPRPEHGRFESWRKPAPGMLLQAAQDFDIDLATSFMIGDRRSDQQAAQAAGVSSFLFVESTRSGDLATDFVPCCKNLADAKYWLEDKLTIGSALPRP